MNMNLFTGELVRLCADQPGDFAEHGARWTRNSEHARLSTTQAARPFSVRDTREWHEKHLLEPSSTEYHFSIHTLDGDRFIGDIELDAILWSHRESFVGISIGNPEDWGKGYGTDAMRIVLRYAFTELNLRRVSLNTFEYNPRAVRSYEKAGFRHEGRERQFMKRDDRRWDVLYMGILQEEWYASNHA